MQVDNLEFEDLTRFLVSNSATFWNVFFSVEDKPPLIFPWMNLSYVSF